MFDDMTTCGHSPAETSNSGGLTSLPGETPAKKTAQHECISERHRRASAMSSSALLTHFARALFSEKTRRESVGTLPGLGFDSEPPWSDLATWFCPSDSEPVALGLSIDGIGCSCSPSVPTPTASQIGCRDVPRLLDRRQRLKEQKANGNGFGLTLGQWIAVACWTPTASNHKESTGKGSRRNTLAEQLAEACGPNDGTTVYPHPEFVEELMGFPIGHSEPPP